MSVFFILSYAVLWLLVIFLVIASFSLARQIGILHVRLPAVGARMANAGPEIGSAAPQISTTDLAGRTVTLGGSKVVNTFVLFVSPWCSVCEEILPAIKVLHNRESLFWEMILIGTTGDEASNREFARHTGLTQLLYVVSDRVSKLYNVTGSPYALVIDREGIVRSKGIVNTLEQMESLMNAVELGYSSIEGFLHRETNA